MTLSDQRVLLAEDNPTNQLVAAQMLESLGASVTVARDGAEALEIAERESFDVMLIDIEMPRVSGIDVIRTVRAWSGPGAETPMIALTAYVMREHRAAVEAAGADGIIAKPILSIEQFGADIRRFMSARAGSGAGAAGGAEHAERAPPDGGGARPPVDRGVYDSLAQTIGSDAMGELLDKVETDVEAARDRLTRGLEAGAVDEIRAAAHVLISVAGAVGATRVQESARRLHEAARPGNAEAVAAEAEPLLAEIGSMLDFLRGERGS